MSTAIPPWVSVTHPVRDGEEIRATVKNRQPNELQQRTDYLKARLDATTAGEAIFARDVALEAAAAVGHAVYWDASDLEYKRAQAAVSFNNAVGGFTVAESSYVVGIVANKSSSTRGDILLAGQVRDFDFTNATGAAGDDPAEAGPYFLSASVPGHYTKQQPPVSIYVGFLKGDSSAIIMPTPRDVLDQHVHYIFDLTAKPAGLVECPESGHSYIFIEVDESVPGWLPATDPVFNGLAPIGAKFGYNIDQDPKLSRVWPPLPVANAYLEMDGIGVNPAWFSIDNTTIWWFEDCYGKAPFATEPRPCDVSLSSSSFSSLSSDPSSSSGSGRCDSGPLLEELGYVYNDPSKRRMRLYFTKMVFKTNNTVVTSLRPAPGSPITVTSCDGATPATTGELCLNIDLSLAIEENQPGYLALKDIDGQTFKRGPVLEAVKAGSNIVITPTPGHSAVDGSGYVYGKFTLDATIPGSSLSEGVVSLVALDGAREDRLNGVFFLNMPSTKATALTGRIVLPKQGLITNPQMQLVFWVLGRASGVLPDLQLSYKRLTRPSGCTAVVLPSSNTNLADLTGCTLSAPNSYVEETSDLFTVADGDEVIFTLSRAGFTTDGYNADIGLLKIGYQLTPGP